MSQWFQPGEPTKDCRREASKIECPTSPATQSLTFLPYPLRALPFSNLCCGAVHLPLGSSCHYPWSRSHVKNYLLLLPAVHSLRVSSLVNKTQMLQAAPTDQSWPVAEAPAPQSSPGGHAGPPGVISA